MWGASAGSVKKWLHVGGEDAPAKPEATAYVPDQPIPSDVPLPPRRTAPAGKAQTVAAKAPKPPAKPAAEDSDAPDATGSIAAEPNVPAPPQR